MKTKFITLFLFITLLTITSCSKTNSEVIHFSELENMHTDLCWAVVNSPYVAFKEKPEENSDIIAHGRKGDILTVIGKNVSKSDETKKTTWYQLPEGWIEDSLIIICQNQYQAQTASKQVLGNN